MDQLRVEISPAPARPSELLFWFILSSVNKSFLSIHAKSFIEIFGQQQKRLTERKCGLSQKQLIIPEGRRYLINALKEAKRDCRKTFYWDDGMRICAISNARCLSEYS